MNTYKENNILFKKRVKSPFKKICYLLEISENNNDRKRKNETRDVVYVGVAKKNTQRGGALRGKQSVTV